MKKVIILTILCTFLTACNNLNRRTVWDSAIPNNSISYQSARAKCNAIGQATKAQAESQYNATHQAEANGGFAAAFENGLNAGQYGRDMGNAAFKSCMAQNNYVSRRVG